MPLFSSTYQPTKRGKPHQRRKAFNDMLDRYVNRDVAELLIGDLDIPLPSKLTYYDSIVLRLFSIVHHPDTPSRDRLTAIKTVLEYALPKPNSDNPIHDTNSLEMIPMDELESELERVMMLESQTIDDDEFDDIEPAIVVETTDDSPGTHTTDGSK